MIVTDITPIVLETLTKIEGAAERWIPACDIEKAVTAALIESGRIQPGHALAQGSLHPALVALGKAGKVKLHSNSSFNGRTCASTDWCRLAS